MFVPSHVSAHTCLCIHTFVPTHISAHKCLCPQTFVPILVCACIHTLVPYMSATGQKCVLEEMCVDTNVSGLLGPNMSGSLGTNLCGHNHVGART